MPPRQFSKALVVDDDTRLARSVAAALTNLGVHAVETASDTSEAIAKLEGVDLLVCDICLNRESGIAVIDHAHAHGDNPAIIAISGAASRRQVFELNSHGVAAFLDKPFTSEQLADCLVRAADASDLLERAARAQLGRSGAREAQQLVRETMFREALALTNGNRHAAARLLRVDRRLVQMMAAKLEDEP